MKDMFTIYTQSYSYCSAEKNNKSINRAIFCSSEGLMFCFYISIVLQTRNCDSFVLTFRNPHPNDAVFIIT